MDTESIKWISSDGAYLTLHAQDRNYVVLDSLKNLIEKLDPEQFKRIHKSTIVNLNTISEMQSRLNGDYDVTVDDGTVLRLSRNYAKGVKELIL